MKSLLIIASVATLAGCATQPGYYASSGDPYQWRTVSVTDVNLPPGAPRPDHYTSTPVQVVPQNSVTYSSSAATPVYSYAPGTAYYPAPRPYYYNQPQVSIGLGFGIGRHGWLGINQHFGGPYGYAPYSYWPHSIGVFGHRHWSHHHGRHHGRHHGPRHQGPRRHR